MLVSFSVILMTLAALVTVLKCEISIMKLRK